MLMNSMASSRKLRIGLDLLERVVIATLFLWLTYRVFHSLGETPFNLLFLVSEGAVALFVLFRRSTDQISVRPLDWATALIGTMLPMMIVTTGGGWAGGVVFMLAGLVLSLGAKFSLRRSFGVVAANRGIKTGGMYAAVRHPMYLGYFLVNAGALMVNPSWINVALLGAWAVCQIIRIHAEERILFGDQSYREHARKVRFRVLPFVY